jgi:PD-(D/E)XK nuclease superfamily
MPESVATNVTDTPEGRNYTAPMSAAPSALPRRKLPIGLQTLREIREQGYYDVDKPDLGQLFASEHLLSTFDVGGMPTEALLQRLCGDLSAPGRQISRLWDVMQAGNVEALRMVFHAFFASIPNDWYRHSTIAQFEGYWASVFYSHFAALGLDIQVEDSTNRGRIDMVVLAAGAVWVFEFKVVELVPQGKALAQIRDRGCAEKYRDRGEPIHLIGVEFSRIERNIVGFEVETAILR